MPAQSNTARISLIQRSRGVCGLCFAMVVALTLSISAAAQEAADLVGGWAGVVDLEGRNVVAILEITAVKLGQDSGSMEWKSPTDCGMQTEYGGAEDNRFVLNISSTNGGFCDRYSRGTIKLSIDPDRPATLSFELLNRQGSASVPGNLDRESE